MDFVWPHCAVVRFGVKHIWYCIPLMYLVMHSSWSSKDMCVDNLIFTGVALIALGASYARMVIGKYLLGLLPPVPITKALNPARSGRRHPESTDADVIESPALRHLNGGLEFMSNTFIAANGISFCGGWLAHISAYVCLH